MPPKTPSHRKQREPAATSCAHHEAGETGFCTFHRKVPFGAKLYLHAPQPSDAGEQQAEQPRPMETAPRDGTMVRLLVDFDEHSTEDGLDPAWTIGAITNDELDAEFQFAGWCWDHDHFTEGKGKPVGWLPMLSEPAPSPPSLGDALSLDGAAGRSASRAPADVEALAELFDQARVAEWERLVEAQGVRPGWDRVATHKASTEAGIAAVLRHLSGAQQANCWCNTCRPQTLADMRFVACPDCGYKRCPKANDHRNSCTGSNAVGQPGSSWEHVKPAGSQQEDGPKFEQLDALTVPPPARS